MYLCFVCFFIVITHSVLFPKCSLLIVHFHSDVSSLICTWMEWCQNCWALSLSCWVILKTKFMQKLKDVTVKLKKKQTMSTFCLKNDCYITIKNGYFWIFPSLITFHTFHFMDGWSTICGDQKKSWETSFLLENSSNNSFSLELNIFSLCQYWNNTEVDNCNKY